ncbi:cytochrome P450 [Actinocorallia longicatena]|uniref:Cytochrome P450 n=1 Tax=Actinocorallia longicatena TaxID=111803 RepID=A0ABP6QJY9_9ACTN
MEIDVISPDVYERGGIPHEQFTWLRENDPVHRHADPAGGPGFWAVTRHEEVVQVSRRADLFSSRERLSIFEEVDDQTVEMYRLMMLFMDPPEHTERRAMVNKGFTPRMIRQLTGHVRDISRQLVAEVAGRGEADFVADIAAPLPAYVICELLGAPVEDRELVFDLSNRLIGFDDPEYASSMEDAAAVSAEILAYAGELADLRRARPGSDLATQLLRPDESGRYLTDEEFQLFVLVLMLAGNETTRNSAAGGMIAFFEHPGQWELLLRDRSLLRTAPDEIVRWSSPVNLFRRTAMADTVLGGTPIAAGDKVVVFYPSANRDAAVFADPFTFDITRSPNPHLGFGGGGPHFCLGTHLARLQLSVLFEALLDRLPDLRPTAEPRRLRSNFINGIKELPVAFTPS